MVLIHCEWAIIIDHLVDRLRSVKDRMKPLCENLMKYSDLILLTIDTYITCIENIYTVDHELTHENVQLYAVRNKQNCKKRKFFLVI